MDVAESHHRHPNKVGYKATTHERCLYYKPTTYGKLILVIWQLDDIVVAAFDHELAKIGEELFVPLNDLGLIKKFNCVGILQTQDYVKVSCGSYISKIIFENHGRNNLPATKKLFP